MLRFEYFAPPRGNTPDHVHPRQEERFEVISGTLGVRVGRREQILSAGQSVVGLPGVPHAWWNTTDEEVCFLSEFRPALNIETLFVTGGGIVQAWRADKIRAPKYLLQLAVLIDEVGIDFHPTRPPVAIQKALIAVFTGVLAPIGRLLGYKARYPEYSGPA